MLRALALLVALQQPATPAPTAPGTAPTAAPTATPATASDSTRRARRPMVRRTVVTPELARSAFADARARTLLDRARAARLAQDSALQAYDARTYQRVSAGLGVRRVGAEKLLFRLENAAQVSWSRGGGARIQLTGRRAVVPMLKQDEGGVRMSGDLSPVPYFPGRESLWFPGNDMGVAKASVDEDELLHPLATGAEAYYRYATGDSISIRLPDGRRIALRELRITARWPEWRAFVGSFWFDVERGSLVRAAYRMAADLDVWQLAGEDTRRQLDSLRTAMGQVRRQIDSVRAAVGAAGDPRADSVLAALRRAERSVKDDDVPGWVQGTITPMRARLSAITVEYGLHEGRFWLPRRNVAEAEGQAGFFRVPLRIEETFRYQGINANAPAATRPLPALAVRTPSLAEARTPLDSALALAPRDSIARRDDGFDLEIEVGDTPRARRDTLVGAARAERVDSLLRRFATRADSLGRLADSARARGDTVEARRYTSRSRLARTRAAALARREVTCATGGAYDAGTRTRYGGNVPVSVVMPCDTATLSRSADLPPSPYVKGEQLFSSAERDELLASLDFSLQPGWGPQPIRTRSGLGYLRFNRVEALSVGGEATQVLGLGYTAGLTARIGVGDWVPNAELSLTRSDGRRDMTARLYHRLAVANDDWGNPLGFGASVATALYGRDEGFYYRAWGAELAGTRPGTLGGTTFGWRLFGERQRAARRELSQVLLGRDFEANIAAADVTALGAGAELARTFGENPEATRLTTRLRGEGAGLSSRRAVTGDPTASGATGYGRLMGEATATRGFGPLALALTGAAGGIVGDAPVQRLFYVGGLQSVRGQWAAPTNATRGVAAGFVGDAFWLGRTELGLNRTGVRPAVFYDLGWAGPRADFGTGRALSGVGAGLSLLDGLIRTDVSRGIWPERRWRVDLSLQARF